MTVGLMQRLTVCRRVLGSSLVVYRSFVRTHGIPPSRLRRATPLFSKGGLWRVRVSGLVGLRNLRSAATVGTPVEPSTLRRKSMVRRSSPSVGFAASSPYTGEPSPAGKSAKSLDGSDAPKPPLCKGRWHGVAVTVGLF